MNIPSPAAVKKLSDDRKAREAELASSLANAKEKMPPTKAPSKRSESSVKRKFAQSASSLKSKDSRDLSSKSNLSERTSPKKNSRKPSVKKASVSSGKPKPVEKKPFERPEHLTQRPLRNNEALLGLKESLEKATESGKDFVLTYSSDHQQSNKGLQTKKENN